MANSRYSDRMCSRSHASTTLGLHSLSSRAEGQAGRTGNPGCPRCPGCSGPPRTSGSPRLEGISRASGAARISREPGTARKDWSRRACWTARERRSTRAAGLIGVSKDCVVCLENAARDGRRGYEINKVSRGFKGYEFKESKNLGELKTIKERQGFNTRTRWHCFSLLTFEIIIKIYGQGMPQA